MDLSIIIVNYNTKEATYEAVKSCLNEGSNLKTQIIVVDNGSTDNSNKYLSDKFSKEKKVSLIRNEENLGFSKGVNIALRRSSGEFKLLLNSDTKVTSGSFAKLINFAKSDENIGIVGTKLILPDGSIQNSCFNFPSILNAMEEYWFGLKGSYSPFYKDTTSEVDAVVGASFLITPKAFKNVGLMDERYFMFYEDIDYCRKVKRFGLKVIYFPQVEIYHFHGLSGKKLATEGEQWRRLIPSSMIYHGVVKHKLINFIIWSGQVCNRIINRKL